MINLNTRHRQAGCCEAWLMLKKKVAMVTHSPVSADKFSKALIHVADFYKKNYESTQTSNRVFGML